MLTYNDILKDLIEDVELEIEAIKHSFQNTTTNQRNSYSPFAVYFSSQSEKSFAIMSRPVHDEGDYFSAISELLFAYSSTDAHAVMLAIDSNKQIDGKNQDLLEVYIACIDFCQVISMPYDIDDSNNFVWKEELFDIFTLEKMEKAYDTSGYFYATLEIFEALFLHVHLHKPIFDFDKLKSYYKENEFEYVEFDDNNQ